jgi:hypothetical protein
LQGWLDATNAAASMDMIWICVVWIGMAHAMYTNPFHKRTIIPPMKRKMAHVMV